MSFLQLVSFGVTQSMTGKQWIKMVTNGGLNACVKASKSTISFVLTTSVVSNLTGKSPAGSDTAAPGEWVKGPGYKLFAAVKEELGELNIIAEDLGFMTDEVIELRERTGFPGMKILQFAFNPEDESIDSPHLAPANSVMYTGTHDNNTVLGWYRNEIDDATREYMARYTNRKEYETVPHAMLRTVFSSVSFMAIATMQDLLELDETARMNFPSTLGGNWSWRMTEDQLTPAVEGRLA